MTTEQMDATDRTSKSQPYARGGVINRIEGITNGWRDVELSVPPRQNLVIDVDRLVTRTAETEVKIALMELLDAVQELDIREPGSRSWEDKERKGGEVRDDIVRLIKEAMK